VPGRTFHIVTVAEPVGLDVRLHRWARLAESVAQASSAAAGAAAREYGPAAHVVECREATDGEARQLHAGWRPW